MSIEHDLRQFLMDDPAVIDITQEVHRNDVPPEIKLPYVRFQANRANDDLTRDGYGQLAETVFTVDCFAETQDQADLLATAVKTKLQTINDVAASTIPVMGDSTVRGCFVRDKEDDYEPHPPASDEVIEWSSMSAEVWHV